MQFFQRKRRQPPAVIIVSLIDILIVLLIFLMVTTTFKQTPGVKLALPEAKDKPKPGAAENLVIVTVAKTEPFYFVGDRPITLLKLQEELSARVRTNTGATLAIRADKAAPVQQIVSLLTAARDARMKVSGLYTVPAGTPQ